MTSNYTSSAGPTNALNGRTCLAKMEDVSSSEAPQPKTMPIAIIGMSCRFPGGSTDPRKLWDLLANGRSGWSEIPESRFNAKAWYHPDKEHVGTSHVEGGYFLDDISRFDASFFDFSSEVARTMDPEIRMQLECVYEAFENAGITLEDIAGSDTSVFAGTCFRDYHDSQMRDPTTLARFFLTGNGMAMVANRVSHFFDLRGPSITSDLGCSTTLTLLHLACQSLRAGESKMAVVGGSNALINPDMFISGTNLGFMSPAGKCYAFDSRASGYGRGEGSATLILKPLEDAIRDGDTVRAVVRETAANQDGKTPTLTSPSQEAQEQLMRGCYYRAGLEPRETGYVEAHGTGTQAGDTAESAAIGAVLGRNRPSNEPLLVGSIKTNIGHTEAASGLAAIIKVILAIEHDTIPPSINFEQPNPTIDFDKLGIRVPTSPQKWPSSTKKRASVNNFGYGGSNAHAIIEHPDYLASQYQPRLVSGSPWNLRSQNPPRKRWRVFRIAAKDELSTRNLMANICQYVGNRQKEGYTTDDEDEFMDRLAFTLGQKRSIHPWTKVVVAQTPVELMDSLASENSGNPQRPSHAPRIGFIFSGQGAQWYAMGRELYEEYPVYRHALDEASKCLQELGAAWSLTEELRRDEKTTRINEVSISLPASVAIQIALACLLRSWGVKPTAITGHSSGEISAAFAAGVIDMESALAIVYTRGTLTKSFQKILAQRGSMLAAGLSREEADPYIGSLKKGKAVVACVNSQSSVTISGDSDAIEELEAGLSAKAVFARRLRVDAAYHSHHMVPIADDYREALSQALVRKGEFEDGVAYFSPVTGDRIYTAETVSEPEHWVKNMIQPVEFLDSFRNMCLAPSSDSQPISHVLEVGPHAALQGPVRQILSLPELKNSGITYYSCLRRGEDAVQTMQQLACSLLESGCPLNMASINFPRGHEPVQFLTDLPKYPWNHSVSHWHEPRISRTLRARESPAHELLGIPSLDSHSFSRRWRHVLRLSDIPWARDHQIQTNIVFPGAGYLGMAVEACRQTSGSEEVSSYHLRDVDIMKALVIPESAEGVEVQLSLQATEDRVLAADGWYHFQIFGLDSHDMWHLHCEGLIMASLGSRDVEHSLLSKLNGDTENNSSHGYLHTYDVEEFYESLRSVGIKHGPTFQNIGSVTAGAGQSICHFKLANLSPVMPFTDEQTSFLHPTTLDSAFQAVYTALPSGGKTQHEGMVPRFIRSMTVTGDVVSTTSAALFAESVVRQSTNHGFESDVTVGYVGPGEPSHSILELKGLRFQSIGNAVLSAGRECSSLCFTTVWEPDIDLVDPGQDELVFPQDAVKSTVLLEPRVNGNSSTSTGARLTASLSNGDTAPATMQVDRLREFFRMISHKRPRTNILEVGAGAGDLTEAVLDGFRLRGQGSIPVFAHYTASDPHIAAVKAAEERFSEYAHLMSFKQLDLEDETSIKTMPTGAFDVVLMSGQAATFVQENESAFSAVREMVTPGGMLLLVDSSTTKLEQHSSPPKTNGIKHNRSYESFEGRAKIFTVDPTTTIIWSRINSVPHKPVQLPGIAVAYAGQIPQHWVDAVGSRLSNLTDNKVQIQRLPEVCRPEGKIIVFVDNVEQSLFVNPSHEEFEFLKSLLLESKGVLWVSTSNDNRCIGPRTGLHHGLIRTLRCEYPLKKYVLLDFDDAPSLWHEKGIAKLFDVFQACFTYSQPEPATIDLEYAVHDGIIKIPRVVEDAVENANIAEDDGSLETVTYFSDRTIRVDVQQRGSLDSLVFVDDTESNRPLPADHVQIRPAAFGLNFRDIMIAMGHMEETKTGYECSGYITDLGPEAKAKGFEVGDRVYANHCVGFASTIRIPHTSIAKVPEGMDMQTAASIPLAYLTAYHCLYNMAGLKQGETILIHCGAGAVGQAAIMLAQLLGAHIFVTVGSQEKRDLMTSRYGIPVERIFSSRNTSFSEHIMAATNNKGVDVILNSLAGSLLRATWDCIAAFGRFVEIGKRDLELNNSLHMAPFTRSTSFSSIDLMALAKLRPDIIEDIWREVSALLHTGCIKAVTPLTTFSISELEKAYRLMQSGRHMGKIVIVPNQDDEVKVRWSPYQSWTEYPSVLLHHVTDKPVQVVSRSKAVHFCPDFTYLLVGGLGGVGQAVTKWMVQRGAKNIVILSRSARSPDQQTASFLAEIQLLGANLVAEACDVADEIELQNSLNRLEAQLPPIKGVIQSAMVLRDVLFESMTRQEYQAAIRPKVQGSWNLHRFLPKGLDFFVMLSSVSGFGGNATQANYAAGSTFQDALARHRAEIGEVAVSLDLGAIEGIGVLAGAQGKRAADRFKRLGMRTLNEDEVLRLIEGAVRDCRRSPFRAQVATGFPGSWARPSGHASADAQSMEAFWQRDARFLSLEKSLGDSGRLQSGSETDLPSLLDHDDISKQDALAAILKSLVSKVASMFTVPETDIDTNSSLSRIGVDSLVAVELRNWVTIAVKVECSVFDVMQAASIAGLADKLVSRAWARKTS